MAHMAGLTKADEISRGVSAFRAVEKPEWFNVVDRKALADMFSAFGAVPTLILHDSRAGSKPTAPAICPRPTNPIGGIFSARSRRTAAGGRAKARTPVLLHKPRLSLKSRATMGAGQRKALLPSDMGRPTHIFRPERIRGAFARAKFVAYKVGFGRSVEKGLGLPFGAARHAAKSRYFRPVGLNLKRGLADFTGFFNHSEIIPETGSMGNRSTLIACRRVEEAYRQPDMFVESPAKAHQKALSFDGDVDA